jgi:hypothetical protein
MIIILIAVGVALACIAPSLGLLGWCILGGAALTMTLCGGGRSTDQR